MKSSDAAEPLSEEQDDNAAPDRNNQNHASEAVRRALADWADAM